MQLTRIVLLIVTVTIMSFVLYRRTHPVQEPRTTASGSGLVLEVRPISITNNLELGEFAVPAKSTHDVRITATESQMQNPRLSGVFSTNGGSGIKVILLDEDQYNQFRKNSTPSGYVYLAGTAVNGNINARLPHAGIYYLVFDNSFSDSAVNVKASVAIRGEIVQVQSGGADKK